MYCTCTPGEGYPSTPACCVDPPTMLQGYGRVQRGAKWASVDLIYLSGNLQRPSIVRARYRTANSISPGCCREQPFPPTSR